MHSMLHLDIRRKGSFVERDNCLSDCFPIEEKGNLLWNIIWNGLHSGKAGTSFYQPTMKLRELFIRTFYGMFWLILACVTVS